MNAWPGGVRFVPPLILVIIPAVEIRFLGKFFYQFVFYFLQPVLRCFDFFHNVREFNEFGAQFF